MKRVFLALTFLAMALPLYAQDNEAKKPAQLQADKLGPGDTVRVTVFQQPDLTTEARVSDRGTIGLPLIGETAVSGSTAAEAATRIADAYKKGQYFKNPQVNVALMAVRSRRTSAAASSKRLRAARKRSMTGAACVSLIGAGSAFISCTSKESSEALSPGFMRASCGRWASGSCSAGSTRVSRTR